MDVMGGGKTVIDHEENAEFSDHGRSARFPAGWWIGVILLGIGLAGFAMVTSFWFAAAVVLGFTAFAMMIGR